MRKSLVALFLVISTTVYGLEVDRAELTKAEGATIHFVNYVGPHAKVDTLEEIFGIGRSLGAQVGAQAGEFSYFGKYRVIHAVGPAEGEKLDADIFIIEKDAEVDNIANVMRIVGGYLQAAYAYSPADAATLARFVVYYNAAFRGNLKYLQTIYKSVVMERLTAENAGIATVYSEWPGKTRMVIPLTVEAAKGSLSALSTGQLIAPKVIENLQSRPGKGVPARQAITELRQREVEQGQRRVAEEQNRIAEEQKKLAAQQEALKQAQSALARTKEAAAAPGANPEQKQAVVAQESEVQKQQAQVQTKQNQIAKAQAAVAAQEQQLAQREKSVQAARASIAADEQALIQQSEKKTEASSQAAAQPSPQPAPQTAAKATAQPGTVLFIYDTADSPEHLGKLVLVDRVSGKLLSLSDLNSVRGRRYVILTDEIVVAAGRADRGGAIRLVAVEPNTLAVAREGTTNLVPSSYLIADGESVYAVVSMGNAAYLGRFDRNLALQAQSDRQVDPHTYITVVGSEVYVQDAAGNILILNKDDLREKKRPG